MAKTVGHFIYIYIYIYIYVCVILSAFQSMYGLQTNLGVDRTGEFIWITNEGRDTFLNRTSNFTFN